MGRQKHMTPSQFCGSGRPHHVAKIFTPVGTELPQEFTPTRVLLLFLRAYKDVVRQPVEAQLLQSTASDFILQTSHGYSGRTNPEAPRI